MKKVSLTLDQFVETTNLETLSHSELLTLQGGLPWREIISVAMMVVDIIDTACSSEAREDYEGAIGCMLGLGGIH
jgi:hypothetical protein